MASDVNESLRRFVAERAGFRCEYCLLHERDSYSPHQIDHIISRKHGGQSDASNLAYACLRCNACDVGSIDPESSAFVSLFHPRRQHWDDHFVLRTPVIEPLTSEGRATARVLKLNIEKRVVERQLLAAVGRYRRYLHQRRADRMTNDKPARLDRKPRMERTWLEPPLPCD